MEVSSNCFDFSWVLCSWSCVPEMELTTASFIPSSLYFIGPDWPLFHSLLLVQTETLLPKKRRSIKEKASVIHLLEHHI